MFTWEYRIVSTHNSIHGNHSCEAAILITMQLIHRNSLGILRLTLQELKKNI